MRRGSTLSRSLARSISGWLPLTRHNWEMKSTSVKWRGIERHRAQKPAATRRRRRRPLDDMLSAVFDECAMSVRAPSQLRVAIGRLSVILVVEDNPPNNPENVNFNRV